MLVPLEHIFNLSLTSGNFPDIIKQTLIVPFFKQGEKNIYSNYCPISLTYTLSNIVENCMKTHLYKFLEKSFVFSENQYGFRHKKGT